MKAVGGWEQARNKTSFALVRGTITDKSPLRPPLRLWIKQCAILPWNHPAEIRYKQWPHYWGVLVENQWGIVRVFFLGSRYHCLARNGGRRSSSTFQARETLISNSRVQFIPWSGNFRLRRLKYLGCYRYSSYGLTVDWFTEKVRHQRTRLAMSVLFQIRLNRPPPPFCLLFEFSSRFIELLNKRRKVGRKEKNDNWDK